MNAGTEAAGQTIVVIEPDVLVRMAIAKFLRTCGFRVIEGTVADDVWAAINSGVQIDVVFTEVRLPGKTDGFSLASLVRQNHPQIEVILTATPEGAGEKSKHLCEGPIGKPYNPEDVTARIRGLIARRRSAAKI